VSDKGSPNQAHAARQKDEDALEQVRRLMESDPASALKRARALIQSAPDPRALRLAAAAHRRLGEPVAAELAELAGINISLENATLKDAAAAQLQGRRLDAKRLADAVLRADPDDLLALAIAAEAAIGLRELDDADEKLRRALTRAPGFLRASILLATSLKIRARVREAISVLEHVLERESTNVAALTLLAESYGEIGEIEATVETYRRLIRIDPSQPRRWIVYAQYLRILGRSDESKEAFRKALSLDSGQGAAWWGLAHFFPGDLKDEDVQMMERALVDRAGTANDEAPTRIALSIIADRRGDYEQAFSHLKKGKRLRLQNQLYDAHKLSADVDDAIRNFTAELFETRTGSDDDSPIFIVGMPRSGSTLVERILGQHSGIEAAGELQVLPKIVDPLRFNEGRPVSYAELVASLPSDALAAIGNGYVERSLEYRRTSKPRFVDKFNLNWLHTGLIRLVLPNAKILDVRRNALDCCWSNFKMLFADGHANDLRHIGQLYRDYVRLIDHVETVAPGAILRVRYEDLVADVEGATRRMLEFVGVPFEPRCVDFHLSDAPVATPSSEQVRRPITKSSIGSAEPYRKWLGPLIEELSPLADV
jgi:tetratricopeptide (TPR) repeat protein